MPRAAKPADPLSAIVDLLADALASRLDFPPRASSAASALGAAPRAPARRARRRTTPARLARLAEDVLDALATRLDFPPRASSATSAYAAPPAAAPARAGALRKGGKRPPARVGRLADEVRAHVESHPGERIEQIARALRRPTRELALPVRRLLERGTITSRRVGRETRYYGT